MPSNGINSVAPPEPDELEVSTFGPGFGECVVLHLGFGDWVIVDSCRSLTTKQPIAIDYLATLGVSMPNSVKLIVATHWHDDHVQGLSEIFKAATSARFASSGLLLAPEFQAMLDCWDEAQPLAGRSGVEEVRRIFEELARRQRHTQYPSPIVASANKVLWERHVKIPAQIRALSPSDSAVSAAMARLAAEVPPKSKVRRRLPDFSPNDASIVLTVQVEHQRILLGGDLEIRQDSNLGWSSILNNCAEHSPHDAYKVPHHGSTNGDHLDIWQRLLTSEPCAVVTPFVKGRVKLPTLEDARRISDRTKRAYLTAPPKPGKFGEYSSTVERTVRETTLSIHVWPRQFGHVRLLKKIGAAPADPWRVQLFGAATTMGNYVTTSTE